MLSLTAKKNTDATLINPLKNLPSNFYPAGSCGEIETRTGNPNLLATSEVLSHIDIKKAAGQRGFDDLTHVPQPFITSTHKQGGYFAVQIKSVPAILSKTKEKTNCNAILLSYTTKVMVLGHAKGEELFLLCKKNDY